MGVLRKLATGLLSKGKGAVVKGTDVALETAKHVAPAVEPGLDATKKIAGQGVGAAITATAAIAQGTGAVAEAGYKHLAEPIMRVVNKALGRTPAVASGVSDVAAHFDRVTYVTTGEIPDDLIRKVLKKGDIGDIDEVIERGTYRSMDGVQAAAERDLSSLSGEALTTAKKEQKLAQDILARHKADLNGGRLPGQLTDTSARLAEDAPLVQHLGGRMISAVADNFTLMKMRTLSGDSIGATFAAGGDFIKQARLLQAQMAGGLANFMNTSKGNIAGLATSASVEAVQNLYDKQIIRAFANLQDSYNAFKHTGGSLTRMAAEFSDDHPAFRNAVVKVLQGRGSDDPLVKNAAEGFKSYFKSVAEYAKKVGVDLGDIDNYFPQIWNKKAIMGLDGGVGWKKLVTEFLQETGVRTKMGMKKLDPEEAQKLSDEIYERVIKGSDGHLDALTDRGGIGAGSLAERELRLHLNPKAYDKFDQYLDTDLEKVLRTYNRRVVGHLRFKQLFGSDKNFKKMQAKIMDLYRKAASKIDDDVAKGQLLETGSAISKDLDLLLSRAMSGTAYDMSSVNDIIGMGTRTMKNWNVATMMGGLFMAGIGDMAQVVASNTLGPRGIKLIGEVMMGMKTYDEESIKLILGSIEAIDHKRTGIYGKFGEDMAIEMPRMAGTGMKARALNVLDRGMETAANLTLRATFFAQLEQRMRIIASSFVFSDFHKQLPKLLDGTLDDFSANMLRRLNIDDNSARKISAQLAEFGEDADGLFLPHIDQWTDLQAIESFSLATSQRIDEVVVRPGLADRPFFGDGPLGQLLFQFQGFGFAVWPRVGRGIASKEQAKAMGHIVSAITLGAMVGAGRDILAGRELDDNPADYIYDGIHRSGLLGWLNNPMMTMDRLGVGPGTIMGAEAGSRWWEQKEPLAPFLGPSVAKVDQFANALMDPLNAKKMSRLIPAQNLAWWQGTTTMAKAATSAISGDTEE